MRECDRIEAQQPHVSQKLRSGRSQKIAGISASYNEESATSSFEGACVDVVLADWSGPMSVSPKIALEGASVSSLSP